MDKTAIVILNWNGRKMLERFLPSVVKYSCESAAVYVADNASTDDSVSFLEQHYPEVHVIRLERNWGFAEGYNRALQQVEAIYYVLLNSDVEVTHHWIAPLTEYMDSHEDVCACQPKLLSERDHDAFEYAGASGGYLDKYGYPYCRGRVFDTVERDNGQYDNAVDIHWATGACMMIRSEDYRNAGGLDGRFFAHNEEIDLCWRLRLRGRRIVCLPDSKVYHVGGGTLPKGNPRKTYLNFRNNLTMLYKNLPDEDLHLVMRRRWWLDYIAAWQTLILNRNLGDFKAIYKARRDFKRLIPSYQAVRSTLQQQRTDNNMPDRAPFSIVWQYYAKGRKHFSDLPESFKSEEW